MPLQTTIVNIQLVTQSGQPMGNTTVSAELNGIDFSGGELITPETTQATTDSSGNAVLNLWPNSIGSRSTRYTIIIRIGSKVLAKFTGVEVPVTSPVTLQQVLGLTDGGGSTSVWVDSGSWNDSLNWTE